MLGLNVADEAELAGDEPRRMMQKWAKRPTRRTRKRMVDLARVMADS